MSAPATQQPSRGVAVPAAVGVVVAAVVAALAVVGLVVSLAEDTVPTGPPLPPPAATSPELTFDPATLGARFANVSVTMPTSPYVCPSSPAAAPPLFSSAIMCGASVHTDYQGTSDWAASVGFGPVSAGLIRPTAEATAQAFFDEFRRQGFGSHTTTVTDDQTERLTLGGQQVTVVSGQVRYEIAGLPSTHDRVVVVALPTQDDGYLVYLSSRPNDAPTAVLDPLNASIGSLRIE